jgi:hypothetical protein
VGDEPKEEEEERKKGKERKGSRTLLKTNVVALSLALVSFGFVHASFSSR